MKNKKLVKVCGLRDEENVTAVIDAGADMIGLIFYPKSPRYVGNNADRLKKIFYHEGRRIKKIGVFVDAPQEQILKITDDYKLDYVQLHGNESPDECYTLQKRGLAVIKAFSIESDSDIEATREYEGRADYFLFDTKSDTHGGSGKQFDWKLLSAYAGNTLFLLSGGIGPDSLAELKNAKHPLMVGIDLNSCFESAPAVKDVKVLRNFITNYKENRMNRIDHLFKTNEKKILSIYYTAGYPKLDDTVPVLRELQAAGVDMVEVGIPFSDPMADGPVIQAAATTALRNGMSLKCLFKQLKGVRKEIEIPIVLMGYLNPVMQFGFENFCMSCQETGVDGVIIPDLPYAEYMQSYKDTAEKSGLKVIMLITPETSEERIRLIDKNTSGFIYMVSSAATTGTQQSFNEQKTAYFRSINNLNLNTPRLVGFGISNKATYDAASAHSSGVIVGSRFVQLLASEPTPKAAIETLKHELGLTE